MDLDAEVGPGLFNIRSESGFRLPDFETDLLCFGASLFDFDTEAATDFLDLDAEVGPGLFNIRSESGFRLPDFETDLLCFGADFFCFRADLFYLQANILHVSLCGQFRPAGFVVFFNGAPDFSSLLFDLIP